MSGAHRTVNVKLPAERGSPVETAAELLRRRLEERSGAVGTTVRSARPGTVGTTVRSARPGTVGTTVRPAHPGAKVSPGGEGDLTVRLALDPGIGEEGFRIEDAEAAPDQQAGSAVRIVGNDGRGLLYGVGKFLRTSRCDGNGFTPGAWRGSSVPDKPVRGIYFATHFHNFYHDAPIQEVERYVEELSLWGCNALTVWFDMHHYAGIDEPEADEMIDRLRGILGAAGRVGMDTGLLMLGNEAYTGSPEHLRAVPTRWHYRVELCPSKPGAMELLLKWRAEVLQRFSDLDISYVWIWPHDQGGCLCGDCAPWGANGFLKIAEPVARVARDRFPSARTVLSTWLFDRAVPGEYEGLARAFEQRPDWVDYLMVDSHGDFPDYVVKEGAPGGLPVLNFPEISMYGMYPWGGLGANPLPRRFQHTWEQCGHLLAGGFPYSEGIYEDINKVICLQFYWDACRTAHETVREYAAYEFSPDSAEDVCRAVAILEENHRYCTKKQARGVPEWAVPDDVKDAGSKEACALLETAARRLSGPARESWRWRILYLRALIDRERLENRGLPTARCMDAFQELTSIYHAEAAHGQVAPPIEGRRRIPA